MFILFDIGDLAGGYAGIVMLILLFLWIGFYLKGGITVVYAISMIVTICSIILFFYNLITIIKYIANYKNRQKNHSKKMEEYQEVLDRIKNPEKYNSVKKVLHTNIFYKKYTGLIFFMILLAIGCIFPFYGIFTHIKYNRIISIFIPQFICTFIFWAFYDDEEGGYCPKKKDGIKGFFKFIVDWIEYFKDFLFHKILGMFMITSFIVMFMAMSLDEERQEGTFLYDFYHKNYIYENYEFDEEREKIGSEQSAVLAIISNIRNDLYNDTKFKEENNFGEELDSEQFMKSLGNYTNYLYENFGEKTGYYISMISYPKDENAHLFYIRVRDMKYYTNIYYIYNFTNNTLEEIKRQEFYELINNK